jgi:hypothetical protein
MKSISAIEMDEIHYRERRLESHQVEYEASQLEVEAPKSLEIQG